MNSVMTLPAHADGWTVEDLESLPDDELRYELVDGSLHVSPPATNLHDYAASKLGVLLDRAVDGSWRVIVGGGIRFDDRNYRSPDLLVVEAVALRRKMAVSEDVVLAVEVMSPSSVTTDRLVKPAQYAAAGIAHYWRLELGRAPALITHELAGDVYVESGRFTDAAVIEQPVRLSFQVAEPLR